MGIAVDSDGKPIVDDDGKPFECDNGDCPPCGGNPQDVVCCFDSPLFRHYTFTPAGITTAMDPCDSTNPCGEVASPCPGAGETPCCTLGETPSPPICGPGESPCSESPYPPCGEGEVPCVPPLSGEPEGCVDCDPDCVDCQECTECDPCTDCEGCTAINREYTLASDGSCGWETDQITAPSCTCLAYYYLTMSVSEISETECEVVVSVFEVGPGSCGDSGLLPTYSAVFPKSHDPSSFTLDIETPGGATYCENFPATITLAA